MFEYQKLNLMLDELEAGIYKNSTLKFLKTKTNVEISENWKKLKC